MHTPLQPLHVCTHAPLRGRVCVLVDAQEGTDAEARRRRAQLFSGSALDEEEGAGAALMDELGMGMVLDTGDFEVCHGHGLRGLRSHSKPASMHMCRVSSQACVHMRACVCLCVCVCLSVQVLAELVHARAPQRSLCNSMGACLFACVCLACRCACAPLPPPCSTHPTQTAACLFACVAACARARVHALRCVQKRLHALLP